MYLLLLLNVLIIITLKHQQVRALKDSLAKGVLIVTVFLHQINLESGQVTTVAGDGKQGSDKEGGKIGTLQSISSPWDVAVGPPPGL